MTQPQLPMQPSAHGRCCTRLCDTQSRVFMLVCMHIHLHRVVWRLLMPACLPAWSHLHSHSPVSRCVAQSRLLIHTECGCWAAACTGRAATLASDLTTTCCCCSNGRRGPATIRIFSVRQGFAIPQSAVICARFPQCSLPQSTMSEFHAGL